MDAPDGGQVHIHGIDAVADEDRASICACFTELANLHGNSHDSDGPRELQVKRTDAKTYRLHCFGFDEKITDIEMTALVRLQAFQRIFLDWGYEPRVTFQPSTYQYVGALVVIVQSKDYQRAQQRARNAKPDDFNGPTTLQGFLESGAMQCFFVQ